MNWVRMRVAVVMLAVVSLACAAAWAQKGLEASGADSAGIKKTLDAWTVAFNSHDPHAIALNFAEDADFTNMRGMSRHGRKDIEEFLGTRFAVILKDAHRTDTLKRIRLLAPDVAFVDADWEMTGSRTPEGKENSTRKGLLMLVMTKQSGQWLITVFHEADL
jgi:uncharacterized protein (TIGR02246 family)